MEQYTKTGKNLEESKVGATEKDISIINEIISVINYVLEWMRTAKQPGLRRSIERRVAYQKEKTVDTLLMQRYFRSTETLYEWDDKPKENSISHWDWIKLEDALSTLTEREKEIFMMSKGNCFSMGKVSEILGVTKSTVQTTLERANKKVTLD
ncbi:sigma-70 family RNA polymerase sigma factor [Bacillus thuringiensis]|uniref:sigma-70 family RNA polymerase sigma factor n=1 Tax=Bacillus thuringiensis TaxID=1428 RepID=UPI000A3696D6|nr:sigma-70 family RNA polymerase sigma factor [Bacillus thuringiensis]MED3069398.1 sigma-70 family RNA polymerase sigma factor [Bacillus thuringiensis]OUB34673.1 RNA polymerase subunit sigma-24 [Bacillus thuringiensis serovar palmanyolensis]